MQEMNLHPSTQQQQELIEACIQESDLSLYTISQLFPVFATRRNIARFLVHYEIFKQTMNLPGIIVDLGVYQGASTFTWAKFCEIFCPTDIIKKVYGFDTFEGFPSLSKEDGPESKDKDIKQGGYYGGGKIENMLVKAQEAIEPDKHIKGINRIELIKGNAVSTIPEFVKDYGNGLKISILNLDLDLYEPTMVALEHFVPRMTRGGIIIIDEYALKLFGGETKAVDDYFTQRLGNLPKVKKFTWHSNPSAYIVME